MLCRDGRGQLCMRQAEYYLLDENGKRVPGNGMCEKHAREVIEEYREKLGLEWRMEKFALDEFIQRDKGTFSRKALEELFNFYEELGEEPSTVGWYEYTGEELRDAYDKSPYRTPIDLLVEELQEETAVIELPNGNYLVRDF